MSKLTTFLLLVSFSFLSVGCPSPSGAARPDDTPELYSKEYWGEWICGSNGASWYITAGGLTADRDAPQGEVTLKKQSARVIEVTEDSKTYYLYASRTANASFTGSIAKEAGAALAASGTGFSAAQGVQVKITNERNPALSATASTNISGEFAVPEIIPGDKYKVEPEGGTAEIVTIGNSGEDIGTITLTKGVNFKTRVLPWQDEYGEHLFVNNDYTFTIEIENTGTEDCRASTYALSWRADNLTVTVDRTSGVWGTLEPGMKKQITLGVKCKEIPSAEALEKINIAITDSINRKTWTDSVSFVFKRGVFDLNIAAKKEVNGVVIPPKGKALYFKGETTNLILPWYDTEFLIFFCGATIETETYYSFGVGRDALLYSERGDLESATAGGALDPGAYELNDSEAQAKAVGTESAMEAFLHKNDIDFYKFNAGNIDPYRPYTRLVNWNLFVDGADSTANTTKLTLDFSMDMGADFTADNITLSPALTKDVLVNKGGGRYELPVSGAWTNNTALTVRLSSPDDTTIASLVKTAAIYKRTPGLFKVSAQGTISKIGNQNLADSLAYIAQNAIDGDNYLILKDVDEMLAPQTLSYSNKTVGITLLGDATISLSAIGSLFTVSSGVTLTLADNVKLVGRSDNTASLVRVISGGTLIMKEDAVISGNTSSNSCGGVLVLGGTFTMSGGTISSNTALNGGGVDVRGGTFTMNGGIISGNTSSNNGGGVRVVIGGTFTMSGGIISGNTADSYGGGVFSQRSAVWVGTNTGGIIYGNDASPAGLQNIAGSGGQAFYSGSSSRNFTMQGNFTF